MQLAYETVMRITVSGVTAPATDNRAYAEYRFFTSIAPYEPHIRSVDVVIRRDPAIDREFVCTATVDFGQSRRVSTRARAVHPSAAIDRAADRMARLVARWIRRNFSLKSSAFST